MEFLVAVGKAGVVETHARGQLAEDLRVGLGLAQRRDGRVVGHDPGVAVGGVDVAVLELRGRRQHIVGMVGGVGQEVLQHHGEQVLAAEAGHHLGRVGRHRHRVAVVDHHGLDPRAEAGRGLAQQVVADRAHVQRARPAAGEQVGPLQPGIPLGVAEPAAGAQQQAIGVDDVQQPRAAHLHLRAKGG